MTSRKTSAQRAKDLRVAILRIERGRAKSGVTKLSISSVAKEAGITPALIHNHYPEVAEQIRTKQAASSTARTRTKISELQNEKKKNADLRREIKELQADIARLASINEMLRIENNVLRTAKQSENVKEFRKG